MFERIIFLIKRNYFWVNFSAASVLAVSMSAVVAEGIASNLDSNSKPAVAIKEKATEQSGQKFARISDYDNILGGPLLGDRPPTSAGGGEVVGVANIKLIGTVAGPWQVAAATVQLSGEKSSHEYGIGRKIGDLKLISIRRERIVLRNEQGDKFSVYVDGDKKPKPKAEAKAGATHGGVHNSYFQRDELKRIVANPALIMKGIKMRPKKKNKKLIGYKVRRLKKEHLVHKLGARKGDVITRINGKDLNNPQDFLYLMQELDSMSQITIDLIRKKKPMTYNIIIQ